MTPVSGKLALLLDGEEIKGNQITASETRYTLNDFSIDDGSFTVYGSPAAAQIISVSNGTTTYEQGDQFIIEKSKTYTFTIQYADGSEKGTTTTTTVSGV